MAHEHVRSRFLRYAIFVNMLLSGINAQFYTPYEVLPLSSYGSSGGTFSFPAGSTQSYDEGTPMTIRWSTNFSAVNLYLVYNSSSTPPSVGVQTQLATGYSGRSYDWTVSCSSDCEAPLAIKAVNAFGDADQLYSEGFWSRLFWVHPTGSASSSQISSSRQASPIRQTSSSSQASSTGRNPSTSTSTSAPSPATSTTAAVPTPAMTATPAPTMTPDESGDVNTTAIGAGVGAGVGAILLSIGAFVLWKRRNRRELIPAHSQGSIMSFEGTHPPTYPQAYPPRHHDTKYSDYYSHSSSEVPGWQTDPHELPGRTP